MDKFLLVGIGGALGALLRYVVSGFAHRLFGITFPWGTLVVNVLGCFLIGLAWAAAEEAIVSPSVRLFLLTGILGAFTTFSTFGAETINLFRDGLVWLGVANILASNVAGLAAVVAGFMLTRIVLLPGGP